MTAHGWCSAYPDCPPAFRHATAKAARFSSGGLLEPLHGAATLHPLTLKANPFRFMRNAVRSTQLASVPPVWQCGFTLMEVMVSLVILSASLLGLAALQALGTRYGNESYFRTQAILQADAIIDRMRANASAAATGHYTPDTIPTGYAKDCAREKCSTRELAVHDLVEWNVLNARLLPDGTGSIGIEDAIFTVRISWQEIRAVDGIPEVKSLELSTRL